MIFPGTVDYVLLGFISVGALAYVCWTLFDDDQKRPPTRDGSDDGGLPVGGDSVPRSDGGEPPALSVKLPKRKPPEEREEDPTVSA